MTPECINKLTSHCEAAVKNKSDIVMIDLQDLSDCLDEIERLQHKLVVKHRKLKAKDEIKRSRGIKIGELNKEYCSRDSKLHKALRDLYNDCLNTVCDEQRTKVMRQARKALEE
ncbi:hypothetical protein LCGC14_1386340 [marine sediment metagenome]|uniref:Uncharacterized protein n=1 Tax=marine sediment metagenome TaxID=412755 RepID=A0A0F9K1C4_9ZZZZ